MKKNEITPIYNDPYELDAGAVYNFWLSYPALFDEQGDLVYVNEFKKSLIGNIRKPLTLEEYNAGVIQQIIVQIKIYGLLLRSNEQPVFFHFRKNKIEQIGKTYQKDEIIIETYIIKEIENKIKIMGERSFTEAEENIIFNCLARCFKETTPFDELPGAIKMKEVMSELLPDIFPFARNQNNLGD